MAQWLGGIGAPVEVAVSMPHVSSILEDLLPSVSIGGGQVAWILVGCGIALAGNFVLVRRSVSGGGHGPRSLRCLAPFALFLIAAASSGVVLADDGSEPPPDYADIDDSL